MKKLFISLGLALAALTLCAEVRLANGGKTDYTIIYRKSGDVLLDPAVKDLADTLKEITGAEFPIKSEAAGPKIFIGRTAPGDKADFRSRERRIKSVGRDLYIYGDYRFGTSGAIYNFLHYFCNCRWYTATGDKRIPKNPNLSFDAIDYRHVPSFKSIEHGGKHVSAVKNRGIRAWTRRNNAFLMPKYAFGEPDDAWKYIGPVTHTLAAYIPPIKRKPRTFNHDKTFFAGPHPCLKNKAYFKDHPEYFSLDKNGKRVHTKQVCFSNPEVRRLLLENVDKVIKAEKYDPDQYAVLDFTQNDRSGGFCFCPNCRRLEEKYKTPGGAYFDFLVEMGNHFIGKYPKLMIRFFSYQEDMTGIPPTGLKFPENLSVIIAPLRQDFSKPLTHPYNQRFLNQMRTWGTLCKEIWFWNYPTLYTHGMAYYSLFPGVYRNTENLRNAYDAGVRYIIAEQGGSLHHGYSFKELNVYLQNRMAEDINLDVAATLKEFCDAVYGAASPDIQKYLKETDALCKKEPGYFRYYNDPRVMRRVLHTPANLIRWQHDFDEMERKVADNRRALFNVRRARINLDSITLLSYPECAKFDPKFDESVTEEASCKTVFYCIGQKAEWGDLLKGTEVELTERGLVKAHKLTLQTTDPCIFTGGDIYTGQKYVVDGIGAGREAAESIDRYLLGKDLKEGRRDDERVEYPPNKLIPTFPRQTPADKENGFTDNEALLEAQRCMTCGSRSEIVYPEDCMVCLYCMRDCPMDAIEITPDRVAKHIEPWDLG